MFLLHNIIRPKMKCVNATETVAQRCSIKKVFWKISQNLQENTCATGIEKRDSDTSVSPWILQKFLEHLRWLLLMLAVININCHGFIFL